eukprot:GHVR01075507.1.p1 GENE.GHVR01075507.1~~GHVR01075507.1.p1  ORF type:complete len:277 (-),score=38.39 GHVR01075507.1:1347-2177(-)
MGDWHVGARMCDMEGIEEWCQRILDDPLGKVILMGDLIDSIGITDKRYDGRTVHPQFRAYCDENLVEAETRWCCDTLLPLAKAGKIVAVLTGNHEEHVRKWTARHSVCVDPHYDLTKYLTAQSGNEVRSLGYSGFIRLKLVCKTEAEKRSTDMVTVYANHGFGGGRRPGGHANALDDALDAYLADLTLVAHRHQRIAISKVRIGIKNKGKVTPVKHDMKACITGTFLKTSEKGSHSYSEEKLYKPTEVGGVKCIIRTKHPSASSVDRSRLEIAIEI